MDNKTINALRVRAVSMIEKAKSGHPGMALDIAPAVYTLYSRILKVSPKTPEHLLRDRIVFSAGHCSSLVYSALSAFGYDISIEDLKNFRRLDSITPGHPETGVTPGVDFGTGPLGQGVASAVGFALAERIMAGKYNKPDCHLFDNYTYAIVGDGCLMEGVSHEALSLAGSLKLNKLIVLYDCNKISIEGSTDDTFEQDTQKVMEGYGFEVIVVEDGNDIKAIEKAILKAKKSVDRPVMIILKTVIGFGSHMQGIAKVHGTPLGEMGIEQLKKNLSFDGDVWTFNEGINTHLKFFEKHFDDIKKSLDARLSEYKKKYPKEYKQLMSDLKCNSVDATAWLKKLENSVDMSTRDANGKVLQEIAKKYPFILSGSADVAPSTRTAIENADYVTSQKYNNRNIKFGVREFGMSCVSNGLAIYGGLRPLAATFFVFSDYMKNGIRMSALQNLPVIYQFTHDSIAVGEDGPTHHAVEQLWGLRSIPNFDVYRPCDFNECKACWSMALENQNPSCFVLSRQKLPFVSNDFEGTRKGGYILHKEKCKNIDVIFIATGSEIGLALQACEKLEEMGLSVRIVSMPCTSVFDRQSSAYKEKVLPSVVRNRIAIELGSDIGWYKYVGLDGEVMGVNRFGKSGNFEDLLKDFKFTKDALVKQVLNMIKRNKK